MTVTNKPHNRIAVFVATATLTVAILSGCAGEPDDNTLVVYCAHDQVYSEQILRRFESRTGIRVIPRFDTEATKSLGLTNLLISEKAHPRCDVFWNNQTLGTVALQSEGILHPYKGPGYKRIPASYKDPDGHWTGFAARLRVYIVNSDVLQPTEDEIEQRFAAANLSRIAVAKPLFGTTLSHYALLWDRWGPDKLKDWHADTRERGISEVAGNSTVMNLVAKGTCDLGWTDTDDFFVAQDRGDPVAMSPIRVDGKTICLPNSVAIIKGTKKLSQAQQLVDFLLSAEVELELAKSKARQIPLGPVEENDLPEDVRPLKKWADEGHDLTGLGKLRAACLEWLQSESRP